GEGDVFGPCFGQARRTHPRPEGGGERRRNPDHHLFSLRPHQAPPPRKGLTVRVNRMVSPRWRWDSFGRGRKGNVGNKVNDLQTTLAGKAAQGGPQSLTIT